MKDLDDPEKHYTGSSDIIIDHVMYQPAPIDEFITKILRMVEAVKNSQEEPSVPLQDFLVFFQEFDPLAPIDNLADAINRLLEDPPYPKHQDYRIKFESILFVHPVAYFLQALLYARKARMSSNYKDKCKYYNEAHQFATEAVKNGHRPAAYIVILLDGVRENCTAPVPKHFDANAGTEQQYTLDRELFLSVDWSPTMTSIPYPWLLLTSMFFIRHPTLVNKESIPLPSNLVESFQNSYVQGVLSKYVPPPFFFLLFLCFFLSPYTRC